MQARSHLLHLREGFLETRGRGDALAELLVRSSAPLAALLASVARLQSRSASPPERAARDLERELDLPTDSLAPIVMLATTRTLSSDQARRFFPAYLRGVERLTSYIDRWAAA